jgi:hypothetical protein
MMRFTPNGNKRPMSDTELIADGVGKAKLKSMEMPHK